MTPNSLKILSIKLLAGIAAGTFILAPAAFAGPAASCTDGTGSDSLECGADSDTGTAIDATAIGDEANADGNWSTALGHGADASESRTVAIGVDSTANQSHSVALGTRSKATGLRSTAIGGCADLDDSGGINLGNECAEASGEEASAFGAGSKATGVEGLAFGARSSAGGDTSTALGNRASATENDSTALGHSASAAATGSTALGRSASAAGGSSTALGRSASAVGSSSTALGHAADATGSHSAALGSGASAASFASTAIGRLSSAGATESTAVGNNASAGGARSVALGVFAAATAERSTAIGALANNGGSVGAYSIAVGFNARAFATNAIAIGADSADADVIGAMAEGDDSVVIGADAGDANFDRAIVIGKDATATEADQVILKSADTFTILGNGDVGLGTAAPLGNLDINSGMDDTVLLLTNTNAQWELKSKASTGRLNFKNLTDGGVPFKLGPNAVNGLLSVGTATSDIVEVRGDLDVTGTLTTGGPTCGGGCDAVFDADYDLPSIEEHAAQMFAAKHLPEVGPTKPLEAINVSERMGTMLNELEKAHIYISELNNEKRTLEAKIEKLQSLESKLAEQEARLAKLETLVNH